MKCACNANDSAYLDYYTLCILSHSSIVRANETLKTHSARAIHRLEGFSYWFLVQFQKECFLSKIKCSSHFESFGGHTHVCMLSVYTQKSGKLIEMPFCTS